jgi:hypothetical protein
MPSVLKSVSSDSSTGTRLPFSNPTAIAARTRGSANRYQAVSLWPLKALPSWSVIDVLFRYGELLGGYLPLCGLRANATASLESSAMVSSVLSAYRLSAVTFKVVGTSSTLGETRIGLPLGSTWLRNVSSASVIPSMPSTSVIKLLLLAWKKLLGLDKQQRVDCLFQSHGGHAAQDPRQFQKRIQIIVDDLLAIQRDDRTVGIQLLLVLVVAQPHMFDFTTGWHHAERAFRVQPIPAMDLEVAHRMHGTDLRPGDFDRVVAGDQLLVGHVLQNLRYRNRGEAGVGPQLLVGSQTGANELVALAAAGVAATGGGDRRIQQHVHTGTAITFVIGRRERPLVVQPLHILVGERAALARHGTLEHLGLALQILLGHATGIGLRIRTPGSTTGQLKLIRRPVLANGRGLQRADVFDLAELGAFGQRLRCR